MFLLVGLGNPGNKYRNNRHNIGFRVIDEIVKEHSLSPAKSKFDSDIFTGEICEQKIIAIKPNTYMNLSGRSVAALIKFYKLDLTAVIVIHDDIDLALGKIKSKIGGGAGGHNGLRSIDAAIGKEYQRIRVGVDHPGHKDLVSDYVLHDFAREEQETVNEMINEAAKDTMSIISSRSAGE